MNGRRGRARGGIRPLVLAAAALSSGAPLRAGAADPLALPGITAPRRAAAAEPLEIEIGALRLTPSAQYRARMLFHGQRDLDGDTSFEAIGQRARLGVTAELHGWIAIELQLQDVRLWGEETSTLADYAADGLDLHQAYLELHTPGEALRLRVGRQEIKLDNQRLIGAVGWSLQGRSLDAVSVDYRLRRLLRLRAFYAKLGERDALVERVDAAGDKAVVRGAAGDVDLAAVSVRATWVPWLRPSLTAIFDQQSAVEQRRITVGLLVDSASLAGFSYSAELYLQAGSSEASGVEQQILAFLAAGRLRYSAPLKTSPALSLRVDFLSGDDSATDDRVEVFDTLLATNHKFYGLMDFFLAIPAHTGGLGLVDLGARLSLEPVVGLAAWLDFHHFRSARESAGGEQVFGNELDLLARYTFNRHLALEAVFGVLLPGDALSELRGGADDTELYGYVQAQVGF